MGFLFFSVEYPTQDIRSAYLQAIPSTFRSASFALYEPLPASADDIEWKLVVTLLKDVCPEALLQTEFVRPMKPNDDNYEVFVGPRWKRSPSGDVPTELAGFLGNDEPTPHLDHCAQCTAPAANQRCGNCKIVGYCSRKCQAKHWKHVHQLSCLDAEPKTLWKALHTNDGFLVTMRECEQLAEILKQEIPKQPTDKMKVLVENFALYFRFASLLGGCFVL